MTKLQELVSHPRSYEFDEFRIDVRQRLLFENGEIVPLQAKLFSLLLSLVQNSGMELSKEYLMRTVWPDSCVESSNLTQSMFLLRRVLGRNSDGRRLIVTIPGQGYLFTGDLRIDPAKQIAAKAEVNVPQDQAPRRRSIAVLPFHVFDYSDQAQYLGVGIADALINCLNHIEQMDVRPTGSILGYAGYARNTQDIGRELGVALLITGSIHVEQHQATDSTLIRVMVQLVNVQDGKLVWSDSVRDDLSHILSLQDSLAEKIGNAVSERLTVQQQSQLTKRYTDNDDAYREYLKGRYHAAQWTIRGWTKGIECFSRAVERDSKYALAYCGIADAHYMASNLYFPPIEVMPKAQTAASRALALDDTLAEAHTSMALVQGFFEWNWIDSEASFRRAINLNPKHAAAHLWYGRLLATSGRFDEAIDYLRISQRLDPLSPGVNAELGRALYYARRYSEATEQLRETLDLDPNFWPAHLFLGWVYEQQGYFTEAVAILRRSSELDDNPRTKASLGVAYALSGDEAEAEKVLMSLMDEGRKRHVSAYYIAAIHAALGDNTRAFGWFAKALADRSEWLVWLRVEPRFDALRQDRRFENLTRKVGIPVDKEKKSSVSADDRSIRLVRKR